jgi:hypothetical protein
VLLSEEAAVVGTAYKKVFFVGFRCSKFFVVGWTSLFKGFFAIKLHDTCASEFQCAFYTCSLPTHHRHKSPPQGSKKARQEEVGYVASSVGELVSQPAEGLFCTSALLFFWLADCVCPVVCVCVCACALSLSPYPTFLDFCCAFFFFGASSAPCKVHYVVFESCHIFLSLVSYLVSCSTTHCIALHYNISHFNVRTSILVVFILHGVFAVPPIVSNGLLGQCQVLVTLCLDLLNVEEVFQVLVGHAS